MSAKDPEPRQGSKPGAPYEAPALVRLDVARETQAGVGIGADAFGQSTS